MKTNIKMRVNPEQSRRVQEICFSKNIMWAQSRDTVKLIDRPFLYIYEGYISSCDSEAHFKISTPKEIDADLFIKTNGSCEEIDKGASSCSMLQSENIKLKKKIENLHIALKKKVEKNKLQASEITLLLKQKEELKADLQNTEAALMLSNNRNTGGLATSNIDSVVYLNQEIDKLNTIIKYLEQKCKLN